MPRSSALVKRLARIKRGTSRYADRWGLLGIRRVARASANHGSASMPQAGSACTALADTPATCDVNLARNCRGGVGTLADSRWGELSRMPGPVNANLTCLPAALTDSGSWDPPPSGRCDGMSTGHFLPGVMLRSGWYPGKSVVDPLGHILAEVR